MEVIILSGYTELEKEHIAREHLLPKQMDENGLTVKKIQFQQKAILDIIRSYTREAGVRNLEREIAKTCRKVATQLVKKTNLSKVVVTSKRVQKFLGVPRYKHAKAEEQKRNWHYMWIGMDTGRRGTPCYRSEYHERYGKVTVDRKAWRCDERISTGCAELCANACKQAGNFFFSI
ncbi:MAG: hypothetical protein Ct9H300mP28_03320 [Pseudomonadota bacterium]|nr:MAG: hypothetical protein Ct9H300mP28_03320 [Pseudomonadota bacterium]